MRARNVLASLAIVLSWNNKKTEYLKEGSCTCNGQNGNEHITCTLCNTCPSHGTALKAACNAYCSCQGDS